MTVDEDQWKSMKINSHNFLHDRFSSISDINRLISIILIDINISIIGFHRLDTLGVILTGLSGVQFWK